MNSEIFVTEALRKYCEDHTHSEGASLSNDVANRVKMNLARCKALYDGTDALKDVGDVGWIYIFKDDTADAFTLATAAGNVFCLSDAAARCGDIEQRIIFSEVIGDLITDGPMPEEDITALKD